MDRSVTGAADPFDRLSSTSRAQRLRREAGTALRRRIQERLYEDIADTAIEQDIKEPGGFLAGLMAGYDPRGNAGSSIAWIIENIRSRGPGAMPTESEWSELADMIMSIPAIYGEPVPLAVSAKAAEKLLPYLYATSKEQAAPNDPNCIEITPLTADEIEAFKALWDEQY